MCKIIKKIYMYFKGKQIWNAKMSEELSIQIVEKKREEEKS